MRKILLSLTVVAVTLGFTACKKKSDPAPTNANVMFVNGCAGATNIDAHVSGKTVNGATNIAFMKNSGYKQVAAGASLPVEFYLTGLGTQLNTSTQTLAIGAYYSVYSAGIVTNTSLVFTTDDLTAPTMTGKAKVRFINLSSDNLNTSCYIGSTKLDSNVASKSYTSFHEVAEGSSLKVAMIDQTILTNSGQITGQTLSAGKIYTFMLTGAASGTGSSALTLTVINNN